MPTNFKCSQPQCKPSTKHETVEQKPQCLLQMQYLVFNGSNLPTQNATSPILPWTSPHHQYTMNQQIAYMQSKYSDGKRKKTLGISHTHTHTNKSKCPSGINCEFTLDTATHSQHTLFTGGNKNASCVCNQIVWIILQLFVTK